MRTWWRRTSAMVGLLAAIFSDLRRRAWWAYRHGSSEGFTPLVAVSARRRTEYETYIPTVTPSWQAVAARALPVLDAKIIDEAGESRPTVMVDVTERPDVYDTPRVLRQERTTSAGQAVVGTQWLADLDHERVLLVVTFVEPVSSTWALSFDIPRTIAVLQMIATSSDITIIWARAETSVDESLPLASLEGVHLTITRPAQLRAILSTWNERQEARSR